VDEVISTSYRSSYVELEVKSPFEHYSHTSPKANSNAL